ncbi:MAG: substrate-binding domain-containing protein [Succinivibrionaceae bacterium]|nr:substrate-binding domain-containing protein [Succinivibrionaceae bacterium]
MLNHVKRTLATLAAIAALPLGAAQAAGGGETVNVFFHRLDDPYQSQLKADLETAARMHALNLVEHDAGGNPDVQVGQMTRYLDSPEPMVVSAITHECAVQAVAIARTRNRPVIFMRRDAAADVYSTYEGAWFVTFNRQQAGELQAQLLLDTLYASHSEVDDNHDDIISCLMIKGPNGHPDTEARTESFLSFMGRSRYQVKVLGTADCDWDRGKAKEFVEKAIKGGTIKDVELIVCNNDDMALGALDALVAHGLDPADTPIVGIDGLGEALKEVADGRMLGTILQDTRQLARTVTGLLSRLIKEGTDGGVKMAGDDHLIELHYTTVDQEHALGIAKRYQRHRRQ